MFSYPNRYLQPYRQTRKMKVKIGLIFFLILFRQTARANMSSPIMEGTLTSSAISSKDINILSERIYIKINPSYKQRNLLLAS